jgi:serine/threonine protein kinase
MREKFVEGEILDGRFQTVAPLNHGSFGMVFLAKDLNTGNDVAIKVLTKLSNPACSSALAVDDRSEELVCHNRLGFHPNIVNLLHSFETSAHTYLVLEYCSMGDLYEAIRLGRGPLETEHVRAFLLELVDAVAFMHSKGLYHRDIKPENIFLTQDGSMKLGDFGLATTAPWSYETCVGSDRYMAPEQYDSAGNGYSPSQADIWSIGICLLNILFSRNPFTVPTDSDILFADFRRDRQSLFDVFPNLSQDTFEILINCMAIDPEKRSLAAARDAIIRAVSFTTDEDTLDEFCIEDRDVVRASANREPLRTPSIQSPQISASDSFPWAKALHSSPPMPIRQLSAIPDTESYSEDLFPASEKGTESWFSVHAETPSLASVLESTSGASFHSMAIRREKRSPLQSDPIQITGSLPVHVAMPIPAMSSVFSKKKDQVSKSWSELWDEEESEQEELELRRKQNARSWSQESRDDESTPRPGGLQETKTSSFVNTRTRSPDQPLVERSVKAFDGVNENHSAQSESHSKYHAPRHTIPKSSLMDRWTALGNKRRAYQAKDANTSFSSKKKASSAIPWRKDWGLGSSGFDCGAWGKSNGNANSLGHVYTAGNSYGRSHHHHHQYQPHHHYRLDQDWRRDSRPNLDLENQSRPKQHHYQRRDSAESGHSSASGRGVDVDDDLEWVGGWHDLHL